MIVWGIGFMEQFRALTLVLLASTEQQSLKETVRLLSSHCAAEDIAELIIFLISADCPSAETAAEIMNGEPLPFPLRCCIQTMPGLSCGIFELSHLIESSHFLIIGSDLEMDPCAVPAMIETSKQHPGAIVCASKFQEGARRENYGRLHYLCNRAVNTAVELILHIKGTELISTFQIYPLDLFRRMRFSNPKRTFYEYTIRPLSKGAEYIEIPTNYRRREEGASNFNPKRYVHLGVTFIRTALSERKLLKAEKAHNESA